MQSGVLELARSLYADIERYQAEIVAQMLFTFDHPRYPILRDHFIAKRLKQIEDAADRLEELYEPGEDLLVVRDEQITVQSAMRDFEASVARLREYHRVHKIPSWKEETFDDVVTDPEELVLLVEFSNSERFGRCLDVSQHYQRYLDFMTESATAMRAVGHGRPLEEQLSLINFTRAIASVHRGISGLRKLTTEGTYRTHIAELLEYLVDFYHRIKPLKASTLQAALKAADEAFEEAWRTLKVPSWREFRSNETARGLALIESRIGRVLSLLTDVIETTTATLHNQMSRSPEEVLRELEVEESAFFEAFAEAVAKRSKRDGRVAPTTADDSSKQVEVDMDQYNKEEQQKFASAKNVPLDSEGNPIPMWLYKLHQLDKKFTCQVCGGEVYRGPKVFNEHFREVRHTEGLARLGIREDLDQYHLITSCAEALKRQRGLNELKSRKRLRGGEEEVEDAMGVVMTQRGINEYRRNFGRRR